MIQSAVLREYQLEIERAKLPGYMSRYDDDYFETPTTEASVHAASESPAGGPPKPHFDTAPTDRTSVSTDGSSDAQDESSSGGFGKGILGEPNE